MTRSSPQCAASPQRLAVPVRAVAVLLVFCASGATCRSGLRNPFLQTGPPAPQVLTAGSTLDQVIAAVNQNADRVVRLQSSDASITVPGAAGIPLLRGNIAAERPRRLRVQASTALTGPEVDVGSNDELFWFWIKRNEPPAVYFARHEQFANCAARTALPVEPEWLWDALGLARLEPNDCHEGPLPHGDGAIEVRSALNRAGGRYTKLTVIDASTAWVLEQHVYDEAGQLVASSRARSHRYDPQTGVSLPRVVEVQVPKAQLSLKIDLGRVQINQPPSSPALYAMPTLTGYEQVDLGALATQQRPLYPQQATAQPATLGTPQTPLRSTWQPAGPSVSR